MRTQDPILVHTYRDPRTIGCPLCDFTIDVPPVLVSDALGGVLGMSGDTLARVHAEQVAHRVSQEMERHLERHPVRDWLPRVVTS